MTTGGQNKKNLLQYFILLAKTGPISHNNTEKIKINLEKGCQNGQILENSKRKRRERSENEIEDQEEQRDGEENKIIRKESGKEMEKVEEIVHEKDGGGGRNLVKMERVGFYRKNGGPISGF